MRRLMTLALVSTFLLSGCSLLEANAKMKKGEKPIISNKNHINQKRTVFISNQDREETFTNFEWKKGSIFIPQAKVSVSPINYQSTKTMISTIDSKIKVNGIEYHIWRTADGHSSEKVFNSDDENNHFSIKLDTADFSGQRGEYQVEAYSKGESGELLAKTTVTFQQHVPILMYHAIDDYKGDGLKGLFVAPADFEAQMQYLKDHGFTLLTFDRWSDINKVNKPIFVTFDDGMANGMNALHILEKLRDETFRPTATMYAIANRIDEGPHWLTTADLKEMVNSGIFSIQSHTASHADLPVITNYEDELLHSKEKIEQITGKPVICIAYPYGHFDDKVVEETKKYYQFATTTKPGQFIEKGDENELLLMHRVRIQDTTTIKQFAALVN